VADPNQQPTVELVLDNRPSTLRPSGSSRNARKRWWILGGVVAAILIIGVVLVETVGRDQAEKLVGDRIAASLGSVTTEGVSVDLGTGSLAWQALTGGIDAVTVDLDAVEINGLEASAHIVATEVPLLPSAPLGSFTLDVTVAGDEIGKLAGTLSGLELESIELTDSAIRVSTVFELLFIRIPVALDLQPVAAGDSIAFEPRSVLLGDEEISVADLRDNALVSGLAGNLLDSQEFCVSSSMPAALTIESAEVEGSDLVIRLTAHGIALGSEQWQQYGSCPAT